MTVNFEVYPRDDPKFVRVSWPGTGGRNVDLRRLAEVMADDAGWKALCEVMATRYPRDTPERS